LAQIKEETINFQSGDFTCNLIHAIGAERPYKGPVLLVHGAGVRANIFRPPVPVTFVDYLLDNGYDVWLENWRASIDLPANEWTLDQAAVYDHPAAVRAVLERAGGATLKAVIHCQGSTSFMMSAVAGLLPEVTSIVSNAVALHPIVVRQAYWKLRYAVPALKPFNSYLNPQWGERPNGIVPWFLKTLVNLFHHECHNGVCKFSSFTYGYGFPVLWSHENLDEATHDWIRQEFAAVPLTFFSQMCKCVAAGHLVSVDGFPELPADFVAQAPKTEARFAFVAGKDNRCFDWRSQQSTYDWFQSFRPDFHSFVLIPNYGHLDVFLGKHALRDTFPLLLAELDRPH
jgi:hypothetical protein